MSVQQRLVFGFGVLLLCLAALAGFSVAMNGRVRAEARALCATDVSELLALDRVEATLLRLGGEEPLVRDRSERLAAEAALAALGAFAADAPRPVERQAILDAGRRSLQTLEAPSFRAADLARVGEALEPLRRGLRADLAARQESGEALAERLRLGQGAILSLCALCALLVAGDLLGAIVPLRTAQALGDRSRRRLEAIARIVGRTRNEEDLPLGPADRVIAPPEPLGAGAGRERRRLRSVDRRLDEAKARGTAQGLSVTQARELFLPPGAAGGGHLGSGRLGAAERVQEISRGGREPWPASEAPTSAPPRRPRASEAVQRVLAR